MHRFITTLGMYLSPRLRTLSLPLLLTLLLTGGCSSGYRISQAELQQMIDQQLPVSRTVELFLFAPEIKVDELALDMGQAKPGHLGLSGNASFGGIPGIEPVSARLSLFGRPEFVAAEGSIYLREVEVRSLQLQGESPTGTPLDIWLARSALEVLSEMSTQFFARNPLYTLEEGTLTTSAIKQFAQDVVIENGDLLLTVGP